MRKALRALLDYCSNYIVSNFRPGLASEIYVSIILLTAPARNTVELNGHVSFFKR